MRCAICGLFGWVYDDAPQAAKLIPVRSRAIIAASLMQSNEKRGNQSWGYYAARADKLERGLGGIAISVPCMDLAQHPVLIGHTRFATAGAVTIENCHPFRFRTLVGAHNGMVHNDHALDCKHDRKVAVDSQHIFLHIEENKPLSEIEAYGVITHVDLDNPAQVWFGKFNGGELAVAHVKGAGVAWSSEGDALFRALSLAGIDATIIEIKPSIMHSARGDGVFIHAEMKLDISSAWKTQRHVYQERGQKGAEDDYDEWASAGHSRVSRGGYGGRVHGGGGYGGGSYDADGRLRHVTSTSKSQVTSVSRVARLRDMRGCGAGAIEDGPETTDPGVRDLDPDNPAHWLSKADIHKMSSVELDLWETEMWSRLSLAVESADEDRAYKCAENIADELRRRDDLEKWIHATELAET